MTLHRKDNYPVKKQFEDFCQQKLKERDYIPKASLQYPLLEKVKSGALE